jgi:hypothetical protein
MNIYLSWAVLLLTAALLSALALAATGTAIRHRFPAWLEVPAVNTLLLIGASLGAVPVLLVGITAALGANIEPVMSNWLLLPALVAGLGLLPWKGLPSLLLPPALAAGVVGILEMAWVLLDLRPGVAAAAVVTALLRSRGERARVLRVAFVGLMAAVVAAMLAQVPALTGWLALPLLLSAAGVAVGLWLSRRASTSPRSISPLLAPLAGAFVGALVAMELFITIGQDAAVALWPAAAGVLVAATALLAWKPELPEHLHHGERQLWGKVGVTLLLATAFAAISALDVLAAVLLAASAPIIRAALRRAGTWRTARRAMRRELLARRQSIQQLTGEGRRLALTSWKDELGDAINGRLQRANERKQRRWDIHLRAALAVLLIVLSLYELIATTRLPFPGWSLMEHLPLGALFYVGLAFGMASLVATRLIIVLLSPDRKTRHQVQALRREAEGSRYLRRWCWEIWLGGIGWLPIVATAVDLGFGYVVAQFFVGLLYHQSGVDVLIPAALVTLTQMPFGGMAWLIRFVGLYGLKAPEEKALDWVTGTLKMDQEPPERRRDTVTYWIILLIQRGLLLAGAGGWVWITVRLYGGFLAKPHLTSSDTNQLKVDLIIGGIASGLFFAGMASTLTQRSAVSRREKAANMTQDIANILLSFPVNLSGAVGSQAVQTWGRAYSAARGAELSAAYQQAFIVVVGSLTPLFHSWRMKRRGTTSEPDAGTVSPSA